MELQVIVKDVELSETVRDRVQRKVNKLSRHLRNITDAKVEIYKEKMKSSQQRYVVQMTLVSNGTILRGEERAANVYSALDGVIEVMDHQIERYKGKLYHKGRGEAPGKADLDAAFEDESEVRLVKIKEFVLNPMSVEEAVERMELLGHSFFVFLNSATKNTSVLNRRHDGDYGLLEPRLG